MYEDRLTGKIRWLKGQGFQISPHFHSKEFECKCSYPDCTDQYISSSLVGILEYIRKRLKQPLIITSAYRCAEHQEAIRAGGKRKTVAAGKTSQHELGMAVDIARDHHKLLPICGEIFEAMGDADYFIHVDMRTDKLRRWNYPSGGATNV